jgi:hypothetical protein
MNYMVQAQPTSGPEDLVTREAQACLTPFPEPAILAYFRHTPLQAGFGSGVYTIVTRD